MLTNFWKNPLNLLVVVLISYLSIGIKLLSFDISLIDVTMTLVTAVLLEFVLARFFKKENFHPQSALAAGLGTCIFLRSEVHWSYVLAAAIAIGSKYLIKFEGKHIFNPSNLGIMVIAFLFPNLATLELTQWGTNFWVYYLVLITALFVAFRAKVLTTSISFVISYAVLLILTLPFFPAKISVHHVGLVGPSLILFYSFMITDPKTSPTEFKSRIFHGIGIALIYFFLELIGFRYSLFLASLLMTVVNFTMKLFLSGLRLKLAPSLISLFLASLSFGFIYFRGVTNTQAEFKIGSISPKFILYGVESSELLSCPKNSLFTDKAKQAGVNLKALTEGASWGDFDNDGFDDLFVSNMDRGSILYHNNRNGTFGDITEQSGLSNKGSSSAFFADFDNDGLLDLFLFSFVPDQRLSWSKDPIVPVAVFKNLGNGKFEDSTKQLGLSDFKSPVSISTASFADFDNDSKLDFIITTRGGLYHASPSKNIAVAKAITDPFFNQSRFLVCDPDRVKKIVAKNPYLSEFIGTDSRACLIVTAKLELNQKDHEQTDFDDQNILDISVHIPGNTYLFKNTGQAFIAESGFSKEVEQLLQKTKVVKIRQGSHPFDSISGRFYQPVAFDFDNDGLSDLFIATDTGANLMIKNLGNFQFKAVTTEVNLNYSGSGMGADVADFNNDGKFDLVVTNTLGDFLFQNSGGRFKLVNQKLAEVGVGWGVKALDFDLDSFEDIYIANGDVTRNEILPQQSIGKALFRADSIYRNLGNSQFGLTSDTICPDFQSGKALAVSDYDNDGDQDLFVGNFYFPGLPAESGNILYQNQTKTKNYLKVKLKGLVSNSFGVGAVIIVKTKAATQYRLVKISNSFYSQDSLTQVFGLGADPDPVSVEVSWLSGRKTEKESILPNTTIEIRE